MKIKKIGKSLIDYLKRKSLYRYYTNYIKGLRSTCPEIQKLTKEQKQKIQEFYVKYYGKKIPDYLWHEYYYTRTGVFSEKYIPNYVLSEINQKFYNKSITTAFDDKNLYYILFPDICKPEAYLKCINGHLYYKDEAVSLKDASEKCKNIGEAIIKPTFCSCNGDGVKYLNIENGIDKRTGLSVEQLINNYGNNFVIQEAVHQHPELSRLCPSSVNTIRMVTYRREMDIVMIYAVMRIGKFGSEVDNTSAGGMTCKIYENGYLSKHAICSKPAGKFEKNEAGLIFETFQVPYFDKIFETAKNMHMRMPHFNMVGWDFTINDKNQVVFIEMNAPFGLHQPAAGPGFGEYTEEIFEKCFKK